MAQEAEHKQREKEEADLHQLLKLLDDDTGANAAFYDQLRGLLPTLIDQYLSPGQERPSSPHIVKLLGDLAKQHYAFEFFQTSGVWCVPWISVLCCGFAVCVVAVCGCACLVQSSCGL